jgi:gliding motility-associated-like protein
VDVVVNANVALSLTSGSNAQSVCQNTAIGNITYTIGGGGDNATASGLPAGVSGVFSVATKTFVISGVPTTPGIYNYTVTATGSCLPSDLTGTITVNPDASITLTTANSSQTVCINTPVSSILYSITGGGTGGTVSGLPAGVTGSYSGGVFTISGIPTVSGTFNYTVNTTGTCVQKSETGTITINPDATLSLTSAPATPNQSLCINTAVVDITYSIGGGGSGGTVTGLPAGVTGVYSAGVFTISGSPTVVGTYPFTVTTTGICVQKSLTGTITVNPDAAIALTSAPQTSAQELCRNSTLTAITYSISGGGTGGTVSGLPAGLTGSYSGGVFTISGNPTVDGTFNYTVTTTGTCVQKSATGTIIVNPLPTVDFSFTSPSCATRTITFQDLSAPNVGSLTSWNWNFNDAPANSALQNPTHIFNTPGTYVVELTVANSKGCTIPAPVTKNVIIKPRPQAGFIVPEVCINDLATVFTDTSHITGDTFDPNGYEWNFGDPGSGAGNVSNIMNGSHLYTAIGPYNVMHVATTASGCKDTAYNTIFINAADPVSDFNITLPSVLCSNDSISLVNRSTISQGSVTRLEIYWDVAGAPATFETVDVPVFNGVYKHKYPTLQTTQNYTIRMIAYSGNICLSQKTTTVTVHASPRVQFLSMSDVCFDAVPFQITQASEVGGVPGSYVFSGPGVSPVGIFNPSSVAPGNTYTIKYLWSSTAAGCKDSATQTITVIDTATARFSWQPVVCEKGPTAFNSSTSTIPAGAGNIVSWSWNFGDPGSGANNTSAVQNPSHDYMQWGSYTVTLQVISDRGCRSTVRTMPVMVNPVPRPGFSIPASACLPSANVTFTNSSTIPDNTQGTFSYVWNFGDPGSGALNSATGSSPSHIYNAVGPYNVNLQVTSGAGCVRDTTIVLNTIHPQPIADFTVDKSEVCIGDGFVFTDNTNPMDGVTTNWFWNLDDGNTRTVNTFPYTYTTAGTYDVELYTINSHGCRSTTHTEPITVHPYPVVDAGPDRFVLEGGQVTLEPVVTGNDLTYLWTPNNSYILGSNTVKNLVVKGVDDIRYLLTVTARGGCSDTSSVFIKVLRSPSIPNIFSPNGDGVHDKWVIGYLETYPGCTVDIYNRYGQLVFHSEGYQTPWDGKVNGRDVPIGTYYYIVNPKNGRSIMSGYVDVIR